MLEVTGNIYGMPNAPRKFAEGLRAHLTAFGYQHMPEDAHLYKRQTKHGTLVMAVTVDDFVVVYDRPRMYSELLGALRTKYQAKNLGPPANLLGW